jgi:hypothetical protein
VRHPAHRDGVLDLEAQLTQIVGQILRPVKLVLTPAMPQPMSTPTAAGATAPRIATTDPTVAPLPRCTSGMTATWCATHGRAATFFSCVITCESTSSIGAHSWMGTLRPLMVMEGIAQVSVASCANVRDAGSRRKRRLRRSLQS